MFQLVWVFKIGNILRRHGADKFTTGKEQAVFAHYLKVFRISEYKEGRAACRPAQFHIHNALQQFIVVESGVKNKRSKIAVFLFHVTLQ